MYYRLDYIKFHWFIIKNKKKRKINKLYRLTNNWIVVYVIIFIGFIGEHISI